MKKVKYNHIISLGKDCMSRSIPTRYLLKKKKKEGELTLPFDLAIHRYDAVCDLINNEFYNYVNSECLEIENGIIQHKEYFIRYTHERDSIFFENNFYYLTKKYEERVANFYNYIKDDRILFISTFPVYPIELYSILKIKFPGLNFKLLNFDIRPFSKETNLYRREALGKHIDELLYVRAPVASDEYVWWKENDYSSNVGVDFERYFSYWVERTLDDGIYL